MATTSFGRSSPGDTDDVLGQARSHALDRPNTLWRRLLKTENRFTPTIARLGLGLVILPHTLQKMLGAFGGQGFEGTYQSFTTKLGIPGPLAFMAIVTEAFGVVALIFGALTRVAALAIAAVMLGAIAVVHAPHGFFMDWSGAKASEGFEYHMLAITLAVVCLVWGGGRASIDGLLQNRRRAEGGAIGPELSPT